MAMKLDDQQTLAALVATVGALKDEVHGLRQEIQRSSDQYVSRAEFNAWKTGIDREAIAMKQTLADMRAGKTPWWLVVGGLASLFAVILGAIAFIKTVA